MSWRLFALGLPLVAACYAETDWKPSRPGEIFRYTSVGSSYPLDSIILGQRWMSASKYGARAGDTLNSLPPGGFGGADAIRVRRNRGGIVTELEFDYGVERDIRAMHSEYEADLGAPTDTRADTIDGMVRRISVWRNANTEFRIIQFIPARSDKIAATAVLSDR